MRPARRQGIAALTLATTVALGLAALVVASAPLSSASGRGRPSRPHASTRPVLRSGETGWVLVANHLHSAPMGETSWSSGIRLIRGYCTRHHIDFACLTDHNTIKGWFDAAFRSPDGTTMIPGEEWTSNEGHANLLGFQAQSAADAIIPEATGGEDIPAPPGGGAAAAPLDRRPGGAHPDHAKMVRTVHARGGLVVINHPALAGYAWPEDDFGADACEVNRTWRDTHGVGAKAFYERRLAAGARLAAVGGSDFHAFRSPAATQDSVAVTAGDPSVESPLMPVIDEPVNLVHAQSATPAGVLAAIKARHVQVLASPRAPRCFVAVDTVGSQSFDAGVAGDVIRAMPGSIIRLRIHVTGGRGMVLAAHDVTVGQGGGAATTAVATIDADDFVTVIARPVGRDAHHAVFFEVGELQTVTNPVWY